MRFCTAVAYGHGAHRAICAVERDDVAVAKKKVSVPACLGGGGSERDGCEQRQSCNSVSPFHCSPWGIRVAHLRMSPACSPTKAGSPSR